MSSPDTFSLGSLSVVLPAYNEEEAIGSVLQDVVAYLDEHNVDHEIVVVDDGSTDATASLVRAYAAEHPQVRLVQHEHNRGYGEALRTGFDAAQHDWILLMDSDGQFDIGTLAEFVPPAEEHDFVIGRRAERNDSTLRSLLTAGYNGLVWLLLGITYDSGCAFKLFRRNWWQRLQPIRSTDHKIFSVEILWRAKQAGARIVELPVQHFPRRGGTATGAGWHTIGPMLSALLHLWFEQVRRWLGSNRGQALGLIIASAVSLFMLGLFAFAYHDAATGQSLAESILTMWYRWDALHYLQIAQQGYVAEGEARNLIVFFPLFPGLVANVAHLTGSYRWSGLLIANLSSMAGLYAFYRLAELEFSPKVARAALVALLLWPTAFFFRAPYTEGLFLALSVGAFLAARHRRWSIAGLLGGLAAITRVTGILLLPALAAEYWLQRKTGTRRMFEWLWLSAIPAGLGLYLYLNQLLFGAPLAFTEIVRDHWGKQFAWPWHGLWASWERIVAWPWSHYAVTVGFAEFTAGVALIVGALLAFRFLRLSYAIYVAGMSVLVISTSFLLSTPRYLLTVFPLFMLLGLLVRYPTLFKSILLVEAVLLGFLTSTYVRGWWAF